MVKTPAPPAVKKTWKCILGPGVGSNAGWPSSIGELAGRPVQCVAWQVRQQVGKPGGSDRGVGGWLAGLIGPDGPEPRSCITQLLALAILDNSVGDRPGLPTSSLAAGHN